MRSTDLLPPGIDEPSPLRFGADELSHELPTSPVAGKESRLREMDVVHAAPDPPAADSRPAVRPDFLTADGQIHPRGEIVTLRNHFLLAGMMYQGAYFLLHCLNTSS